MCLVLPARVLAVNGAAADIELYGGMRATVSLAVCPDVEVGQYVLVDRGLVLEVIAPDEAEAILAMYEEIGQMQAVPDEQMLASGDEQTAPVVTAESARHA
ncbi:MAG: HypC/HybG/HupF family hydrogenase formation chaperone [Chloroflexi bacterium]|nr:HypC/HybG/HupF family hydrogenase formation chaperone [Chloroflexota bacterium]